MASGKGLLMEALGRLLLRESRVTAVKSVGDRLVSIELSGAGLCGVAWVPGDKVQVLLPSRDARTYTPVRWDSAAGVTELLVYRHPGDTPGTAWSRAVAVGDVCRFVGPQRSVRAPDDRPVVLFGDETSFAVARALASSLPAGRVAAVFEVASRADSDASLRSLDLADAVTVERAADGAHHVLVAERLRDALARKAGAELVMTGCAQSIQAVRALIKAAGAKPGTSKAYWSVGWTGLDWRIGKPTTRRA